MPLARSHISIGLRVVAGLFFALSIYLVSGSIAVRSSSHTRLNARYSLLALGDTGKVHRPFAAILEGQIAVANALELEDRQHRVDALLMLGDNFYMEGLKQRELVPRLKQNLVLPYCYFLRLEGSRSSEVESACGVPAAMRHAIPIYAVLGNHDFVAPESPRLQREVIPQFISNWHVDSTFATVRELAPGLSLVVFSSEEYSSQKAARGELISALSAAQGPLRILAAHTPMSIGQEAGPPIEEDHSLNFQRWVQSVIDESGVAVQLYLSGHHHSLQVIEGGGVHGPALHIVVGSGARYREIETAHPRRRFQAEKLGFVRVDLVGPLDDPRLVASLFRTSTIPLSSWGGPKLVTRWSISANGELERLR